MICSNKKLMFKSSLRRAPRVWVLKGGPDQTGVPGRGLAGLQLQGSPVVLQSLIQLVRLLMQLGPAHQRPHVVRLQLNGLSTHRVHTHTHTHTIYFSVNVFLLEGGWCWCGVPTPTRTNRCSRTAGK